MQFFISPFPYTPEHNGISECQHQQIIETSLSLLAHASLPVTYQNYVFATIVYVINRMLSRTLFLSSLYNSLFHSLPKYTKFRIFSCLCYPCLRSYSSLVISLSLDPKMSISTLILQLLKSTHPVVSNLWNISFHLNSFEVILVV